MATNVEAPPDVVYEAFIGKDHLIKPCDPAELLRLLEPLGRR